MTPEEKLLALIQQDKRQAEPAATPPVSEIKDLKSEIKTVKPEVKAVKDAADTAATTADSAKRPVVTAVSAVPVTNVPPEKKLKLAESPVVTGVSPVVAQAAKDTAPTVATKVTPPAATVLPSNPVPKQLKISSARSPLSPFVIINRALAAVVVALIALVFYSVMSIKPGIARELDRQIEGAGSLSLSSQTITEAAVPAVEVYLEKVASRSLFAAKTAATQGGAPVAAEKSGAPKDLKLVAVSLDASSPADSMAIIKSQTDSKTYFVKQGQTVGGTDYVLDKVLADRIVLKQKKMEYELK